MILYFYIIIAILVILFFLIQKRRNDNVIKQLEELYVNFKDKIRYQKKSVKSETFISGRRNMGYRFKKCDLIFLENGLVIIPFYNIGKYKIYINFFLINDNSVSGIGKLKRFNLNSFGNAVHIEFGESSVTSTNVEIRLKNLTQEEKNLINIRV